jgi:hypothetical protein
MSATSASFTGAWISLMDYANRNGVSLSTLRRYIKSGKIKHQLEHGRYLIWDENASAQPQVEESSANLIKKLQEENAELKTLVAFYEEHLLKKPLADTTF